MEKYKIASLISYYTNDFKFLRPCIESVKSFSKEVIVVACDHQFSGEPENQELLKKSEQVCNELGAKFILFEYDKEYFKSLNLERLTDPFHPAKHYIPIDVDAPWFWNQVARLYAFKEASDDIDKVMFIDVDEIIDTERFIEWINSSYGDDYVGVLFDCYFYFRDTKYQALQTEDWNALCLVDKKIITEDHFFLHSSERHNFVTFPPGPKKGKIVGMDGKPMVHHYSWVRTEEEMLIKVKAWSHNKDKNWVELVKQEFTREFNPKTDIDFIHGYKYQEVKPLLILE